MHAPLRAEDGPAHGGETVHEELRIQLDDMVLRLKPRDVPTTRLIVRHFAEADEGTHLVHVVTDRLLKTEELGDFRIRDDLQEP